MHWPSFLIGVIAALALTAVTTTTPTKAKDNLRRWCELVRKR